MIGTLLSNRYRIDAQLGEGGMGVVYRAHDTVLDRPVAIKLLSSHFTGAGTERLLREARLVAQLDHPHIVAVYDAGQVDGRPFIAMQLVGGKSLREASVSIEDAVEIVGKVCQALAYAHERGLVHRDIKPDNIMLTDAGLVKVMDFGLARSEGRTRLTQAGTVLGTVAYMAPEQVLSGEADARSDLYSLGCVLYEMVTGRPPFTGSDPITIISQHLQVPPVAPHWYNPKISPELEGIILKLMAKDPAERYESAGETRAALEQLTAGAALSGAEAAAISPAMLLGTVMRTRLVGRDSELRELKSSLELAASGHGQVVLVEGEPGIGKTRLLQEAQVYARLRGFIVLVGRCYEQETGVPYMPFIEMFGGRLGGIERSALLDELGDTAPEFIQLIPQVRRALPDIAPSPPLDAVQERLRLFASVAEYLTRLSRRAPLALVLEDLHWADAASLSLLQHMARTLRGERVATLGSYRDVEVDREHPLSDALREMNRERLFNGISLRRLQRDGVGTMVRTMFEIEGVSDEFLDLLYGETEGNPFFVEEVLKSLVEEGALYREDGRWERKAIAEIEVPKSVREVIGRRLERVSDPCRHALGLAAVIGRRFRFETLQSVGELPEDQLLTAIEEAITAQLVREESTAGEVEYDFVHALMREVLYDRLSLRRRMTLHQKVGETLERQHAGRMSAVVEDLAHHFTRAPHGVGLQKAIQYSIDAGRKAMSVFAHEEAVRYFQNALELLAETGDDRRAAETQVAVAEAYTYLGNVAGITGAYLSALKYYEQHEATDESARVEALLGEALGRVREFSEAIPHLERALTLWGPDDRSEAVIRATLGLGRALLFIGRSDEAVAHLTHGLALATEQGARALQADAEVTLGLAAQYSRDFETAGRHYSNAISTVERSEEPLATYVRSRALGNLSYVHNERGEWVQAVEALKHALAEARRIRDVAGIVLILNILAYRHLLFGEWDAARTYAAEGARVPSSANEGSRAILHRLDGDVQTWIEFGWDSLKNARRTGDYQIVFTRAYQIAWGALDLGNLVEARRAAEEAVRAVEADESVLLGYGPEFVIEALARTGAHEHAAAMAEAAERVAGQARSARGFSGARVGRAMLDLELGDAAAAVRRIEEALAALQSPVWRVLATQRLAWALRQRGQEGDAQRAGAALKEALTMAEKIGDHWKANQLRGEIASTS